MKRILFTIVLLLCFSSCKKIVNELDNVNLEHIKVDIQEKYPEGDFKEYFSSSKIIALETTERSIFSKIDRISLHKDKIFILDRNTDAVLIFSNTGKFLNKIQYIGKGPMEYISLHDFTIDENRGHIILYTDRPYKLITYTIEGQFLKEEKIKGFYFNMGFKDNNLFLLVKEKKDKMFLEYNLETQAKKRFVDLNEKDEFFFNLVIESPNIIRSKNVFISQLYSETIYEYDGNEVKPKYFVDYGEQKAPDNIINKFEKNYQGLYEYITENNYGFGISNFRESKDYVTFNFYNNMIVIYSKVLKKSKAFSFFENENDQLPFYNYFAHDGDDNKIISIYPAIEFKDQMSIYKKEIKPWDKIPDYIKEIDEKLSSNDNPLLIVYTFKE
ncbi:6-bladed beta-propeller [Flavivirga rizhaonensis]|nr:6-bladed beta-propeller [Flavivirga rizhaonensis]